MFFVCLLKEMDPFTYQLGAHFSRIQCSNCIDIDLARAFCHDITRRRKCDFYDPNTLEAYYCDNVHPSRLGLTKTVPIIRKAIDKVF
jgi:hypothetical protein